MKDKRIPYLTVPLAEAKRISDSYRKMKRRIAITSHRANTANKYAD